MLTNWMPIETAPKDGTRILTVIVGFRACVGYWFVDAGKWMTLDPESFDDDEAWNREVSDTFYSPTHWIPLPEAPKSGEEIMLSLLNHDTISTQLRDWKQIAEQKAVESAGHIERHAHLTEAERWASCLEHIDDLVEEIRVIRANHDQMCKDFDARNELLECEQQEHLLTKGTLMVRDAELAAERKLHKAARPGKAMPRPEQRCEPSHEFWFGEAGAEFDNLGHEVANALAQGRGD